MKHLLLPLIVLHLAACTSDQFTNYAGYIYVEGKPMPDADVFEQNNPGNRTYTDRNGFFRLKKNANSISHFLMVQKDGRLIDSIPVIGTSGGERINYYFTEMRKDTLFIKRIP